MTQDRRAARRAAMPIVTQFVERYEREGLEPRVIFASEGGITVGKEPHYSEVFTIPPNYCKPAQRKERK